MDFYLHLAAALVTIRQLIQRARVLPLGHPPETKRLKRHLLPGTLSLAFNLGCPAWPRSVILPGVAPDRRRPPHDDLRVPTKISKAKAAAVAFSMAWLDGPVEDRAAGGGALDRLAVFRGELYRCFTARADALFDLCDAVLCAEGR